MGRFLGILAFLFLLYISIPAIEQKFVNTDSAKTIEQVQSNIKAIKDDPKFQTAVLNLSNKILHLFDKLNGQLNDLPKSQQKEESTVKEKIALKTPTKQNFSVHNIVLGETKKTIEQKVGSAKRASLNEYGTKWYAYHNKYQNFFMVMYNKKNEATGLFTNQDLIASIKGIKLGSTKESIRGKLGKPLTNIQKGLIIYELQKNSDYDIYYLDGNYVTIFYDKHENNTVTALQIIDKESEQQKHELYTNASSALKEGFEYQLFDLTNASRVEHHLSVLSWDENVRKTAEKHSTDMAVHHYFDHTNLKGQSPFDRMKEDHIIFYLAGENLAYGQFSSIFAHEGLMNSLGHRENILRKGYENLGVGVAFNQQSQPYFTENFYSK